MRRWIRQGDRVEGFPTIHILSDGAGSTAVTVAKAAAAAFGITNPTIELLSDVTDPDDVRCELQEHLDYHRSRYELEPFVLFYTTSSRLVAFEARDFAARNPQVWAVDVLETAVKTLIDVTGTKPTAKAGTLRALNDKYFERIEAIEFTIAHDDGCRPEELTAADIVLIGVSRTSKTPLSIYLSQQGYKVANVPLDPLSTPPKQIYEVDPSRLFGLMTVPEVLVDIRKRRLGNASEVASSYADYEQVCRDLEQARTLMRRLGCIVVRTDNRAIEETAQEILRYYTNAHPSENFSARRRVLDQAHTGF
ncbi:MAG: pyruvate, water dikinase regulatory protein [Coriobacteriales bacterium]